MKQKILYLGDTALDQQASYLAGIMSHYDMDFDYVNSDEKFSDTLLKRDYDLIILSDYPASNFSAKQIKEIVDKVKAGMGLLMIGGWESFTGDGGGYNNTQFAEVLPVAMKDTDDRVNFSGPCLVVKENGHEIVDDLPFEENIPVVGGLNSFSVKKPALELLSAVEYKAAKNGEDIDFNQQNKYPLLVVGQYELGRTAAFACDAAPHWVGPFIDWGNERIKARADGAEAIEVGNFYAKFFANLIEWLCKKSYEFVSLI